MDATMWLDSMALAGFVLWCIGSLTMVGGWIVLAWTHGPHRPAHAPVRVPPVR